MTEFLLIPLTALKEERASCRLRTSMSTSKTDVLFLLVGFYG